MRKLCAFAFLVCSCLPAAPARAAVYDVGANTSFATFAAAFASMVAQAPGLGSGETLTVQVNNGSYHEFVQLPLLPNPIQVIAAPGVNATIAASGSYGVYVSGVANVRLEGLRISGAGLAGIFLQNAPQAFLYRNSLQNNGGSEIQIQDSPQAVVSDNSLAPTSAGLVIQNSPSSTARYNSVKGYSASAYSSGITLNNCPGSILTYNQVSDSLTCLQVFDSSAVSVTANVAISYSGNSGLYIDNSPGLNARLNLLVGQQVGLEMHSSASCAVQNNSIWNHSVVGLLISGCPSLNFTNNLLQGFTAINSDAASQTGLASNHNDLVAANHVAVVASAAYVTLSDWQSTLSDLASLSQDPAFANSLGNGPLAFQLTGGSPVLGLGADLSAFFTLDYFQNIQGPWDMGFHDYSSLNKATPTPTSTPSPVLPSATPTPSFSATPTPSATASPTVTPTAPTTPPPSFTATITPSPSPYPILQGRLVTYPNPFNPALGPVNMVFDPADDAAIKVFDIAGTVVAELPAGSLQPAKGYASWDGRSNNGTPLPAGLYFAVLRSSKGNHFTRFTIVH